MDKLIAIKEAAELLGVDPKTLRRWESDGKISPQKTIGASYKPKELGQNVQV